VLRLATSVQIFGRITFPKARKLSGRYLCP
jgi:hypothetical protein